MPLYLNVPFRDKEIVKALGARWDGKERKWFVPEHQDKGRFARWAAKEGVEIVAPSGPKPAGIGMSDESGAIGAEPGKAPKASTLASYLFEAGEAMRRAFPDARWVICEVSSLRKHPGSGHIYMELCEHDASGREIASAKGRIWAGNARIAKKFEEEAGEPLAAGLKIMAMVSADLSPQYGFGLTIEQINASFSVGEMKKKLEKIRSELKSKGIWEKNKGLKLPGDFTRVGVIAPAGAAGLGDFQKEAQLLERFGLCEFAYETAVFEGAAAGASVAGALRRMVAAGGWDALALIRGGGSVGSLNWLNDLGLAEEVCLCPWPVLCGIGHERDETILDEVSALSLGTPSKVIGWITQRIGQNAMGARSAMEEAMGLAKGMAQMARSSAEEALESATRSAKSACALWQERGAGKTKEILSEARRLAGQAKTEIDGLSKEILGLGPQAVMGRGWLAARNKESGKFLTRAQEASAGMQIELVFKDGSAKAQINENGESKKEGQ